MDNIIPEIIYQDDYLVAINKPCGLLTHKTRIAADVDVFALQIVRNYIDRHVYPVHRLDRKTSGVLIFALSPASAKSIQDSLQNEEVSKKYIAIVRGYFHGKIQLDYPLTNDSGKTQEAVTEFSCLAQTELDLPYGKHQTSRYSLVQALPKTGRMHQIRKHLKHLRHPIIGDRPHGCSKQNRLFKEKWGMTTMLLHALELSLPHPFSGNRICIKAEFNSEFQRMANILNLNLVVDKVL